MIRWIASLVALVAFAAEAADVTNVPVEGRRVVLEYTGELVSDAEIRFRRQAAGTQYPVVRFVATRGGTRKP